MSALGLAVEAEEHCFIIECCTSNDMRSAIVRFDMLWDGQNEKSIAGLIVIHYSSVINNFNSMFYKLDPRKAGLHHRVFVPSCFDISLGHNKHNI